jgi:hypothetical protein
MSRMRLSVSRGAITIALICAGIAVTAGCGGGGAGDQHPPDRVERRIVPTGWDTVFQVASSAEDSTLLMPVRPAAGDDGVYLADFHANRILHFDRRGALRWTFGRTGSGPDEFRRIRDLKVDSAGRVWVLDQGNRRLTVLSSTGTVERRIPLTAVSRMPQALVPLPSGEALVVVDDTEAPFVRVAPDGGVAPGPPFPWEDYRRLHYMAGQLTAAVQPKSGVWVVAFQTGDGFFPFRGTDWLGYRGWYAEHIDFPEIEQQRRGRSIETRLKNPPVATGESVSLSPSRLYVLFGGSSGYGRRIVDSYALTDGRYTGSVLLPNKVDDIAWSDGGFYVVYSDPYPHLAFWRPHRAELP